MNDACALTVLQRPLDVSDSLLQPGSNCCRVTRAQRASVIVDADAYFHAFAQAAERAQRSILILAWDFDSRTCLGRTESSPYRRSLGEFLNALAARRKHLKIRILDWDFPLVFAANREISPLYGLTWRPHRRIQFRYDGTHPLGGSHHEKIVVIDDKLAFAGGLDLTCRRWDTRQHHLDDPRRSDNGTRYPPFHDVMLAVDGAAAVALGEIARARWNNATGEVLHPLDGGSGDPWPDSIHADFRDVKVGIACTSPATYGAHEVRDVEQLYLDMIGRAQRYIYLENQYFTSSKIGAALAARLAEPQGPEIIVVSRLLSHGWLEEMTMHVLRTRLIRELRAADRNRRFNVYYPHMDGLAENTCVDVHSKVAIVDDAWLRVGSANVSNRSMGLDTECDLVVEAAGSPAAMARIREIRDELIAEHMGMRPEEFAASVARSSSLHAVIEQHQTHCRSLRPLPDSARWPEAVIDAAAIADPERPVSIDSLVKQFGPIEEPLRRPFWTKAALAGVMLLALMVIWRFTPLSELASAEAVITHAETFAARWWAPFVIVAAYTPASVVMFPRPLITLAAVIAFGAVAGFFYALLGILCAALAGFAAGRRLSRDTVRRLAGRRLNRLSHALRRRGIFAIILVRLVPIAPFIVVSMVAGAIRIKGWYFGLGTVIGMLPGVLAATIFGEQLHTGLSNPSEINLWLLTIVVLVLTGGAYAVQRWLGGARSEKSTRSGKAD